MGKLALIAVVLLILPLISSQYIYGDIYVRENGDAEFFVESDVNPGIQGVHFNGEMLEGITSELTSKTAEIWTFALDLGYYDQILLDIHLPKSLKAVKGIGGVDRAIDFDSKTISLIDSDKDLYFKVDYELGNSNDYFWIYALILVVLAVGVVYGVFNFTRKKRKLKVVFPYLGDNEEKILKMLMKGSIRQKEARKQLGIPKASFTRYVINLEKKRLLIREGEGKNKILRLK